MTTVYAVCAVIGGTVLVCQFVMTLLGLGHDGGGDIGHDFSGDVHGGVDVHGDAAGGDHGDASHGHSSNWLFGVLTFRTIVAALTFFGLTGLAMNAAAGVSRETGFFIALAAGLAAMYGVYALMRGLTRLRAEGTARIEHAVGKPGTVYLAIPGQHAGLGKVHVNVQNRTMEYQARTGGEKIPTGANIVVVGVLGDDIVEVQALPA